jgi:hypothetical protein
MSESCPLRSLRHRQCPECLEIRPASDFRPVTGLPSAEGHQPARQYPHSGHVGPLRDFPIAERPSEPDEGAPS